MAIAWPCDPPGDQDLNWLRPASTQKLNWLRPAAVPKKVKVSTSKLKTIKLTIRRKKRSHIWLTYGKRNQICHPPKEPPYVSPSMEEQIIFALLFKQKATLVVIRKKKTHFPSSGKRSQILYPPEKTKLHVSCLREPSHICYPPERINQTCRPLEGKQLDFPAIDREHKKHTQNEKNKTNLKWSCLRLQGVSKDEILVR